MLRLRVSSLQWAMGGYYALIGILLVVIPHRMNDLPGYLLSEQPIQTGLAALLVGLLLLACVQFSLPTWISKPVHLLSGAALVGLGVHAFQAGPGENPTAPLLFGASLISAAFFPRPNPEDKPGPSNDLFSLTAGLLSLGAALSLLLDLNQRGATLTANAAEGWLFASGFIVASLWLTGMQLYAWQQRTSPLRLKAIAWAGYTLAGLFAMGFAILVLIPQQHWINAGLFAFSGLVLLVIPWAPLYRETLSPASLRLRLAFILASSLAVPMLLTTAFVGTNLEHSLVRKALEAQKNQTSEIASDLADYLARHQSAVNGLARQPGLLEGSLEDKKFRMGAFAAAYPGISSFYLYDSAGNLLSATTQTVPILPAAGFDFSNPDRALSQINFSGQPDSPMLGISAPILSEANEISGLVVAGLPISDLAALMERTAQTIPGKAMLIDSNGRLITHSSMDAARVQHDLRAHPAVTTLLASSDPVGAVNERREDGNWLSTYAVIPDVGWVVLVEQPAANVVSSLYAARDLWLVLLLFFILVGLLAGLVVGDWLTRPFQSVAAALEEVHSDHRKVSFPPVSFQEGYALIAEFEALRKRLANREQALEALRATRRMLEQQLSERNADLKTVTEQLMNAKELLMRSAKDQEWLETALWESERRFRAAGDLIPYGVWVSDPAGNTLYVSQPYLDLLNVTIDEVYPFGGTRHGHPPDDMTPAVKSWQHAIRNGAPWEIQHEVVGPNGEIHYISTRGRPVRDERGSISSWVGVHLDVTEFRQADEKVSEQKKRFRVAMSNSSTMVYTNDRELRYTWVYNPIHGLKAEEMIGLRDEDLFPNADLTELIEFKQAVIQQRKPMRKEVRIHVGNRTLTFDVSAEPHMDPYGDVDEIVVSIVDLTDRIRMAEEIEHNTLLIELQHRLNDQHEIERIKFSRDLHDGPLQDLIAITFQLQQVIFQSNEPELLEKLQEVQANLQEEVRNLRAFCYALRPPLLSRFGLAKAIESYAEGFQTRHPDLKLILDLMEDGQHLPERVRAALFRIFQEGIINIVRHANATEASVRLFFEGGKATLVIEDNGVGFTPPSDWLTLARNGQLGLAGIRERVEGLGGTMELTSSPGSGTRLWVEVPWQREPANVPF